MANNAQVIIASGGDGTVSAVTEALIGKDVALGVISRGTANAFANAAPSTSVLAQGTAEVVSDDGLLDITILAPQTKTGAIATSLHLLQTAANEEAADREGVGYLRSKWVKVTTDPPQRVVLDGEIIGKTPIEVKCMPESLNVFVPLEEEVQAEEQLDNLPGVDIELK